MGYNVDLLHPGYSGADMTNLCREAAMAPIRSLSLEDIQSISDNEVGLFRFNNCACICNADLCCGTNFCYIRISSH